MDIYLKAKEDYYPGFQKLRLFSDEILRKSLMIFACFSVLTAIGYIFVPGLKRQIIDIVLFLFFVFPLAWRMTGRLPKNAVKWYLGFCVFFLASTVPVILGGSYYFLLFMPLTLFCLFRLHGSAPWILESLGYFEKVHPLREIVITAVLGFIFTYFPIVALTQVPQGKVNSLPAGTYLLYISIFLLNYGIFFGVLYGKLMKRLLDKKFELSVAIIINTFLYIIFVMPAVIGQKENIALGISGIIAGGVFSHFMLGMAYYYTRSTRVIFLSNLCFYIVLKTFLP